jgi:hypothetical protein
VPQGANFLRERGSGPCEQRSSQQGPFPAPQTVFLLTTRSDFNTASLNEAILYHIETTSIRNCTYKLIRILLNRRLDD